ncbi:MAG: MotA/TolQ/ExbB proton channel family protein [Planctomycetota bacterium]|nr:MotA/TolQ/ExbB proton channel family protein [Planctomycetota bacterium]
MSYVSRSDSLSSPRYSRFWNWGALCFGLALAALVGLHSSDVQAFQDDGEETAAPAEEPAVEEAADDAPAVADDGGADGAAAKAPESMLSWMLRASGFFGLMIFLCSFIMVALIVMNILAIRRDNMLPPAFLEAFEQKLNGKDYQGAYESAKNDGSVVARVLAAGLSRLNRGYEDALEGMQEVGTDENMTVEHRLSYLAMIGSVAPMLGLLGTVNGMIASFAVIAQSTTQPKPAELADGIATALFTTMEGLIVAIPAIVFYGFLRNRASRFMLEIGMVSEGLMNRFSNLAKGASGAAPTTTTTAPG